jgi:GT2 family glycosyltransferase
MWGGILPSNALIRRTAFEQTGGFDERYAAAEDTDLFMRLGLHAEVHFVNQPLMRYRRHGSQASWDADATSSALDRLLAEKWVAAPMPRLQRKRVDRALNLRRYGASALEGFRFGTDRMRAGNVAAGLRFYAGAVRRYVLYCAANLSSIIGGGRVK